MYDDLIKIINRADNFLITSHINPEGDSVGSVFAMERLLHTLGKKTMIVCHDPIPNDFDFLGLSWIQYTQLKDNPSFQWAIILDSPSMERVGDVGHLIADTSKVINIDHHVSNKFFGAYNVVDSNASSCGEMLYALFKQLHITVSKEVAVLLYTAISTDTGSFRYNNTSEHTHAVISDLIKSGFDLTRLNEQLYSNMSIGRIKLLELFLHNVHFSQDQTIAWSYLTHRDLLSVGAHPEDSEGFVNMLCDIKGVKIAFLAWEKNDNAMIKVSLRAKGNCDVNRIAKCFNGGGHTKASGCTIQDTLEGAIEKLLRKAHEHIVEVEKI